MSEYEARRMMSVRLLRSFPRSAALIFASITAAFTLDPLTALSRGVIVWLALSILLGIIRLALPNFIDLGLWLACSYVVLPIGAWFVKWPIAILGGVIALARGAPGVETAYVLGGILVFDVVVSVIFRA